MQREGTPMESIKNFIVVNARVIIVVVLVVMGVFALSSLNSNNEETVDEAQTAEDVPGIPLTDDSQRREPARPADGEEIGSEPLAGPVEVEVEEETFAASARKGDNQTVIVRQIVNEYLADAEKSLNAPQRLYMETNLVNLLNRDNNIPVGVEISLTKDDITPVADAAEKLSEAAQNRWAAYL